MNIDDAFVDNKEKRVGNHYAAKYEKADFYGEWSTSRRDIEMATQKMNSNGDTNHIYSRGKHICNV